jgi:hypothetical protein
MLTYADACDTSRKRLGKITDEMSSGLESAELDAASALSALVDRYTHAHVFSRMVTYAHVCYTCRARSRPSSTGIRMLTYAHVCSRIRTYAIPVERALGPHRQVYACSRMLTYAHVYGRMLYLSSALSALVDRYTHADVCSRMLMYAHVCGRMLCSRMLTWADVCCRQATVGRECSVALHGPTGSTLLP